MFEKLGQIASLMKNLPKMQEEMAKMQAGLAKILVEADAGGGMVTAKVNGQMEVVGLVIGEEAMKDRELLEDLIRAATNQAIQKAKAAVAEETSKMASGLGLGLPPGMQLPT